jgi:hypothetical protein
MNEWVTMWSSEWSGALMTGWSSGRINTQASEWSTSRAWVSARTIKQSVGGTYFRETNFLDEKESMFLIEENLCALCGTCHSWKRNHWNRDLNESRAVEFPEKEISTVLSILCHLIWELQGLSDYELLSPLCLPGAKIYFLKNLYSVVHW